MFHGAWNSLNRVASSRYHPVSQVPVCLAEARKTQVCSGLPKHPSPPDLMTCGRKVEFSGGHYLRV